MTADQYRAQVMAAANSYLGAKKGSRAHHEIVDLYNTCLPHPRGHKLTYQDNWCAGFVSAIAVKLGLTDIIPVECSCSELVRLYQGLGRWVEDDGYRPAVGDLVFYRWDDPADHSGDQTGSPDHVGIVTEVNADGFAVTEGNMGSASVVGQRLVDFDGRYIRGFAVPDYGSKEDKSAEPWYAEAVTWCKDHGIMEDDTRPNDSITRAEVAQVVYNLTGRGERHGESG